MKCKICKIDIPPEGIAQHSEKEHSNRCGICQETVLPSESIYDHIAATHPKIIME